MHFAVVHFSPKPTKMMTQALCRGAVLLLRPRPRKGCDMHFVMVHFARGSTQMMLHAFCHGALLLLGF